MSRNIIVVDIETGGLDLEAPILEVAALNLDTGEEISFAPSLPEDWFYRSAGDALRINRYFERGVFEEELTDYATRDSYDILFEMLKGNTLAGSNPTFDAARLEAVIGQAWHHRLLDLSAYAAGVLGLPPTELPGAHKVCELLGVTNEDEHSALGDVRATAECFRTLFAIREARDNG